MMDPKPCIRCGRTIDGYARICPFCNWDQSESAAAEEVAAAPVVEQTYVPPVERSWRKPLFGAVGGLLLLVIAFFIGSRIMVRKTPETTKTESEAPQQTGGKPAPRANVTLVPDNGPMPQADQPITSAPVPQVAEGVPTEYQRADATAVSSNEYAQLAQRAQAERKAGRPLVDPRTRTGPAYQAVAPAPPQQRSAQRPVPNRPPPQAARPQVVRTAAVPEYQPMPSIRLRETDTAQLEVLIGTDGRVHEVNVRKPIAGEMGKVIAAVQRWRFKPATENGVPVASSLTVDISFHADE